MSIGDALSIDDYQPGKREAAVVTPLDFEATLPRPTPDPATARAEIERVCYSMLTGNKSN